MTLVAALGLLVLTETGVPIPVPGDLLMLLVGERASAGETNFLVAVGAVQLVTIVGTTTLFFAVRGPARALVTRLGPRVGLTEERSARLGRLVDRPGALALGRMTPGTRTLTVVAAASAPILWRTALPPLLLGSTLFVQAHVVLGYALGPAAREALEAARGPTLLVLALLVVGAVGFWLSRRGRHGAGAFSEASCPACLAAATWAARLDKEGAVAPIRP